MATSAYYHHTSNIRLTKSQNLDVSRPVLQLSLRSSLEKCVNVENEDEVGVAPTSDAPTTSEWSTILLPTKVPHILEFDCNHNDTDKIFNDKSDTRTILYVFNEV